MKLVLTIIKGKLEQLTKDILTIFKEKQKENLTEANPPLWVELYPPKIHILKSVLVCQGCHNKVPQNGQLKEQKFIFS